MADNLYYNKIEVDGHVKIDLTEDTIEPSALLHGYTAHRASGAPITGELVVNDDHQVLRNRDADDAHPISAISGLTEKLEDLEDKVYSFSSLRKLQNYGYLIDYEADHLDYPYAYQYFRDENEEDAGFGCSSIRAGQFLGRTFDWEYNEDAVFAIRVKGGKHASIGVTRKSGLTEAIAHTGSYDKAYHILPFLTLDGINDSGVFVSTSIVPLDYEPTSSDLVPGKVNISARMLPRYILDNFATAASAIAFIQNDSHIFMPKFLQEQNYEIHFLIGDSTTTYVVEIINNSVVITTPTKEVLTNFYIGPVTLNADGSVYTPYTKDASHDAIRTNGVTEYGMGLERFNILNSLYESIDSEEDVMNALRSVFATKAYTETDPTDILYTEFVRLPASPDPSISLKVNSSVESFSTALQAARNMYIHRSRNPESEYYGTWQTLHASVYNLSSKKLHIVFQEDATAEYVIGFDDYYTISEVDALLNEKQDGISDLDDIRAGSALGSTAVQPEAGKGLFSGSYNDLQDLPTIPSTLADLSDDATHRVVTDAEKAEWSGKQDAIEDLETIRYGAGLGVTAVQSEAGKGLSSNDYTTAEKTKLAGLENYDDTAVVTDISEIKEKISSQATPSNKLVSQSEMGDAISLVEAKQLYATSAQGSFATKATLLAATVFYNADGTVATPTKNDVAYVLSDESHSGKSAKYVIATDPVDEIVWGFVITYSDVTFTQAQMSAINSGITSSSVAAIAENTSDITELSEIVDGKIDKVTGAESDNIAVFDTDGTIKDSDSSISDIMTAIAAKETKGKVTVNGAESNIRIHHLSITTDGRTSSFSILGV